MITQNTSRRNYCDVLIVWIIILNLKKNVNLTRFLRIDLNLPASSYGPFNLFKFIWLNKGYKI